MKALGGLIAASAIGLCTAMAGQECKEGGTPQGNSQGEANEACKDFPALCPGKSTETQKPERNVFEKLSDRFSVHSDGDFKSLGTGHRLELSGGWFDGPVVGATFHFDKPWNCAAAIPPEGVFASMRWDAQTQEWLTMEPVDSAPTVPRAGARSFVMTMSGPGIRYEISSDFTAGQTRTIERALQVLSDRLFDPRMLKVVDESIDEAECFDVTSRVARKLGVSGRDVLAKQLELLSRLSQLPMLRIEGYRSADDTAGRAESELVKFESSGAVTGSFVVHLNRVGLPEDGSEGAVQLLAGVVAHEMLHNLGHGHPGTTKQEMYGKKWQMLLFEKAIQTNADSLRMGVASFSRCGPVPPAMRTLSVSASREAWTEADGLDWGEYAVRASGNISYSCDPRYPDRETSHDCGPAGDYENSKRIRGHLPGQLLIRLPDGDVVPYASGVSVWLLQGDSLLFVVNDRDGDYGDNCREFSVTLEQVRK